MAEILQTWLNEEVGLSQKVENFEEDFASGYLFGELLWKFNNQANFDEFSTKDAISHKLQNFERLEPTLRNLNIKFDSKLVDRIMKRERGLALRLLYQLKMCLDKVYPTTDIAVLTKTGQFGDNQPAQKIAMPRGKYDQVKHDFFKMRINALNKPQKQLNMESHVQKFNDEQARQANLAQELDQQEKKSNDMRKQEMRRIQINKLQRNAGFMEEWHQKGVEDWKKNQKRQRDREAKQLEFDLKQAHQFNNLAQKKLVEAKSEVQDGIATFEHTLRSVGINPKVEKTTAEQVVSQSFSKSHATGPFGVSFNAPINQTSSPSPITRNQNKTSLRLNQTSKNGAFTLESTGLKLRTKKTLTDETRQQRNRRRRRLITQQEESLGELDLKQRESIVVELVKRQSNQEKELDYEVWRTKQCKDIIVKNRQLREEQYEKRRELDNKLASEKEEAMLESMRETTKRLVEERVKRNAETQAYKGAAKTKSHTELCSGLLDKIIDIADETFNHQQRLDSKEIDARNWHEWMQLFRHELPIKGVLETCATSVTEETGEEELAQSQNNVDFSNARLNELELVDYLKNQGQWDAKIVSKNKPKLEEILNPPVDTDAKGKGKGPAKGAAATEVLFEESELTIGDTVENNFLLGDALEQIIKINYEQRPRLKHPPNPDYLNLKICLAGYPFAGKKTQAEFLNKKYGLDIFNMEEMVQEALEFSAAHPDPIQPPSRKDESQDVSRKEVSDAVAEASKKASQTALGEGSQENAVDKAMSEMEEENGVEAAAKADSALAKPVSEAGKTAAEEQVEVEGAGSGSTTNVADLAAEAADIDQVDDDLDMISQDEEIELNLEEEFRQVGSQMQELLLDGDEITDNLYVRLFVVKLRMSYEYKSPQQKRAEVKQQAQRQLEISDRLRKIDEELQTGVDLKKKQVKALEAEKSALNTENEEMQKEGSKGWVLVDFPCNYAQSKLLEESLSGYKPEEELDQIDRDKEMEQAFLLVQPTAKEVVPQQMIKSGIDSVFWFNCAPTECQKRADESKFYQDLNERQKMLAGQDLENEQEASQQQAGRNGAPELSLTMSTLVDRVVSLDMQERSMVNWLQKFGVEDRQMCLLQTIDGSKAQSKVSGEIINVVENILEHKKQNRLTMREIIAFKLRKMIESKMRHLLAAQRQKELAEAEESQENMQQEKAGDQSEVSKLDVNSQKTGARDGTPARNTESAAGRNSVNSAGGAPSQLSSVMTEDKPLGRDNIDNDFKPVIMELWQKLASNYKQQTYKIFGNIRMQREQANIKMAALRTEFLSFLHTEDGKQAILDEFVDKFNAFSDEYPDLREDEQTKEELHQRTDCLADELWEIVEERKESAMEFRKKIMESGQVTFFLTFLTQIAQQLMQAELDKFKVTTQILHDYYHAIEEKLIPEAPPVQTAELAFEDEPPAVESIAEGSDPAMIESYSYPRIDRLLAMAIKQQVVADPTQVVGGNDPKKGGKKDPKKAAEEEKPAEESVYVREMKETIKVEKSILRFRLVQIRNWAMMQLKQTRQGALDQYKMLEDWIFVAEKAEIDAIDEMSLVIKKAIEDESKIERELRIEFMDFTVDKGILNYITPPPPLLEAKEEIRSDRFSIPQLYCLIEEIKALQDAEKLEVANIDTAASAESTTVRKEDAIKSDVVLQALLNKIHSAKTYRGQRSGLPEEWCQMNKYMLQRLVRNLDPKLTGFVKTRQLLGSLTLSKSPLMDHKQFEALKEFGGDKGEVSREDFTAREMWFDVTETSQDREHSHTFDRVKMVKEVLCEIFKKEEGEETVVDISSLCSCLFDYLGKVKNDAKIRTYADFLFAEVKTVQY